MRDEMSTSEKPLPKPPRLTGAQWAMRFGMVVTVLCVLAWAWQSAGLNQSWKLWENQQRAVDYLLGKRVDGSETERRNEAERLLRVRWQAQTLERLTTEHERAGGTSPSLTSLMREAQKIARDDLQRMTRDRYEALVSEEMERLPEVGQRRGGYFPPETDPHAIFGDPARIDQKSMRMAWLAEQGDKLGIGGATRWGLAAVFGDGYSGKLLETIAIAIWGTLIAVFLALPGSMLGSKTSLRILFTQNSTLATIGRWVGHFFVRRGYDVSRGFNEIVLAMIFVAVLGLGPLPGVLALLIHTYGILAKVFAEAMDTIDMRQVEGVQATGAAPTQVVAFSVLPQVMPYVVSQSLLRFEANVRGATILGVVGAGGIGQLLMDKFGAYEFQEVATMMIIIIIVVTLIDFGCTRAMRAVV